MLDLSVAMVTHNRWELTEKAINSIYKTIPDKLNWEFVLTDNCSTDETRKELKKRGIKFEKTKENLGFSGINESWKRAKGEYILSIDNDIEIPGGDTSWYYRFRRTLDDNKNIKIVGPALYDNSRWQKVDMDKYGNPKKGGIARVPHLLGCVWFFHRSLLDDVGYIDERFNFGGTDTDYCLRVRQKGYELAVDYSTIWYHSKTTTPLSKNYDERRQRSRRGLWDKWGKTIEDLFGKCPY